MKKQEFGQLVAILRRQMTDFTTNKPWSQAMLAAETALPKGVIIKLEQGLKQTLDADMLLRLADAFHLTTLERQEFFALAVEIPRSKIVRGEREPNVILGETLEQLQATYLPAILYDPFFNIIAVNQIGLAFHGIASSQFQEIQQREERVNLLQIAFAVASPLRNFFGRTWPIYANLNVYQFRAMTLRYRHRTYFQELFAQLSESGEFREVWATIPFTEQDFYTELKIYCYQHPRHGPLRHHTTMTPIVTAWGKLYFSTLTPLNIPTFEVFSTLVHTVGAGILKLTPWPHPALYPPLEGEEAKQTL